MALEISYFKKADSYTNTCYGGLVSSVSYTVTGTSASVGTVASGAAGIARLKAGETCRVSNNGKAASATNGVHLAAGEIIDIELLDGVPIQAITA
jgi:hypothetical protein